MKDNIEEIELTFHTNWLEINDVIKRNQGVQKLKVISKKENKVTVVPYHCESIDREEIKTNELYEHYGHLLSGDLILRDNPRLLNLINHSDMNSAKEYNVDTKQLEKLGFKITGASHRIFGRFVVNPKILEDGRHCDYIITISIRLWREGSPFNGNMLVVRKVEVNDPKEYSYEELQEIKQTILYEGLLDNTEHLQKILSDTVFSTYI